MPEKVSIIIPLKEINDYIRESLAHIEMLDYPKNMLEVIVLPDRKEAVAGEYTFDLKIIETGHIFPGEKRDIGLKHATGTIIAFIDDDVYPEPGWLKAAAEIFSSDKLVGAVGGPAVTPPADSFMQKVSGNIYSSFMGGGGYRFRYMPEKRREVDDYPSCNLLVRKEVMAKIGGFNTEFWPGEDTVICLKITRDLGMKIIYDPGVFVYHHRRNFPGGHLKQVVNYAEHRGYFVKRFPETSLRPSYFVPTAFLLYVISIAYPLFFARELLLAWLAPLGLYAALLILDTIRLINPAYAIMTAIGIFVTHMFYGVYFIKGLASGRLKEENRE